MMDAANREWPLVALVTLNWNGKDHTIECVESLSRLTYPNYRVLIVDNGSTDGSVAAFHAQLPEALVIENGRNLGYSQGFNAGLQAAYDLGAEYVLILNNDTIVDRGVLEALVGTAERDEKIGFVSGKVYYYDRPNVIQTAGREPHPLYLVHGLVGEGEEDRGQYDEEKDYDYLDDIFLLVSRTAYEATGGYDPLFFLYYEETDWCYRARQAGFRLVYTPEARVWHKHGKSTGGDRSPTFVYYTTRNQILFMRRCAPSPLFRRYLAHVLASSPRTAGRYLRHRRFRLLQAYLRGLGAGLAWLARGSKPAAPLVTPN
ncbi:MAG: glycosyltransferase family 2 protein [Anaerolineae bacterium]|nr:glycosyltransferase family 2 protein [Anaerolineae bacterium]